jgi:hypothetical protein
MKLVISYARKDQTQVRAVVDLLTAAERSDGAIFWDARLIAGELWFDQLKKHINRAGQLFVFWCRHASASKNVRREYMYAHRRNKRIVPVLLDSTPLAPELARIHGVDLRRAIRHAAKPRRVRRFAGKGIYHRRVGRFGFGAGATSRGVWAGRRPFRRKAMYKGYSFGGYFTHAAPKPVFRSAEAKRAVVKQFSKYLPKR